MKKQQICILGSTGSIGTQALDVIEQHSDLYEVYCLTANNRVQELAEQARKFHPATMPVGIFAGDDPCRRTYGVQGSCPVRAWTHALCR